MKAVSTILLVLSISHVLIGQKNAYPDSLRTQIARVKNDSVRIQLINELSFYLIFNEMPSAGKYIERGMRLAKIKHADFGFNQLLLTKGVYFDVQGKKDSAEFYFNEGLRFSRQKRFLTIEMMALNNLGMFYWGKSAFNKALNYFLSALALNKKSFPEKLESRANYENNIGLIYQELRQFHRAIQFHKAALNLRLDLNLTNDIAISNANLGLCYLELGEIKKSESYILKALNLADKAQNLRLYYSLHDNLGTIYSKIGNYQEAVEHFEKSLKRPNNVGDNPKSDLSTCINLSRLYNQLGLPRKAREYLDKGLQIVSKHEELYHFSSGIYLADAESRFLLGDLSGGRKSIEKYREITDSIFSKNSAIAAAESMKRYETLEKELTIAQQERKLNHQELQAQQTRLWLILLILVFFMVILLLLYLYKKKAMRANQEQLELKLTLQDEVLRSQQQRLQISRELHDHIGSYLTLISASVEQLTNSCENKQLNTLRNSLKMSMKELRRTVWLINHSAANLDEIVVKMRDFFSPLKETKIALSIELDPQSEEAELSDFQTTHFFRIIQELVNNCVKHAVCDRIQVFIQINESGELFFRVQDNGIGFNQEIQSEGNGISNIKSRIIELNGSLAIFSKLDAGTFVEGTFPIKKTRIRTSDRIT